MPPPFWKPCFCTKTPEILRKLCTPSENLVPKVLWNHYFYREMMWTTYWPNNADHLSTLKPPKMWTTYWPYSIQMKNNRNIHQVSNIHRAPLDITGKTPLISRRKVCFPCVLRDGMNFLTPTSSHGRPAHPQTVSGSTRCALLSCLKNHSCGMDYIFHKQFCGIIFGVVIT